MQEHTTHMTGARAPVAGVDHWHQRSSTLVPADRAPHANRGTFLRPHKNRSLAKARAKLAYAKGLLNNAKGLHANGKPMPAHYLHSSASNQEAPLAVAA
jgi:hypothetical protein